MPKQQKTYTKEFKLEAVQLVKSSGKLRGSWGSVTAPCIIGASNWPIRESTVPCLGMRRGERSEEAHPLYGVEDAVESEQVVCTGSSSRVSVRDTVLRWR
jgi:hypothetical protein